MDRHAELGHFLRSRRRLLTPQTVGLPPGRRRRSLGLRREEVALLANVSPSWYTNLEQGRRVRPSAEVLDALADALHLNHTSRRYVHALGAAQADSVLPDAAPSPETIETVERLMLASKDMPYPVYAIDGLGNLLAWNVQMSKWYDDFSTCGGRDRNIVWWMFNAPQARERIVDWEADAREVVARVRFFVGFTRATSAVHNTVRDLCAGSAEFAKWWEDHDVVDQEARRRRFRHPLLGVRTLDLFVVRPAPDPSMSIIFHLPPADQAE